MYLVPRSLSWELVPIHFPTPTALCPLAQGCRAAATLGNGIRDPIYANGVVSLSRGLITSEGHKRVRERPGLRMGAKFEQRVLYGRGPAQVGFGMLLSSFHRLTLSSKGKLSPEPLRLTHPVGVVGFLIRTPGCDATTGFRKGRP